MSDEHTRAVKARIAFARFMEGNEGAPFTPEEIAALNHAQALDAANKEQERND